MHPSGNRKAGVLAKIIFSLIMVVLVIVIWAFARSFETASPNQALPPPQGQSAKDGAKPQ